MNLDKNYLGLYSIQMINLQISVDLSEHATHRVR